MSYAADALLIAHADGWTETLASVTAQLAVAEELRTANLIAYVQLLEEAEAVDEAREMHGEIQRRLMGDS